jgi:predicted GNAT family N-acyltransferase
MVRVRRAETDADVADALAVRRAVFVEEQGVPEEIEVDGEDDAATHFVAYDGDRPIGAARLREVESGVGKVERVAVRRPRRGEGIGRALMAELERTAASAGIETLTLHAQTHVESFYDDLGYETTSDVFEEAGIEHVEMEKDIDGR